MDTIEDPLTIEKAWKNFLDGVTINEIMWLIITIMFVVLMYQTAVHSKSRALLTRITVVKWFFILCGWVFAFFIFGKQRIFNSDVYEKEVTPSIVFYLLSIITAVISFILFKKNRAWYWIFSRMMVAIIVFGVAFAFALGFHSTAYAILFGILFGIFFANFLQSIQYLYKRPPSEKN